LRLHLDGGITLQKIAGEDQPVYYKHYPRGFAGDCVYTTQRHFIDRLQDGKPFETSGEDYLRTITVLEAAYRAAETHKTVEIPSLK
jgi:predicted dehydrogenase